MRGRPPTPAHLRAIDGNPGKRAIDTAAPPAAPLIQLVEPPEYMTPRGKDAWRALQGELAKVVGLSALDLMAFEGLCEAYGRYRLAREALITPTPAGDVITTTYTTRGRNGTQIKTRPEYVHMHEEWRLMKSFMSELGMTPVARARLKGAAQLGLFDDPLAELDRKHGGQGQAG
jgi:P27 family predicted phage terminase small subunit